jgi:hypothetical protein
LRWEYPTLKSQLRHWSERASEESAVAVAVALGVGGNLVVASSDLGVQCKGRMVIYRNGLEKKITNVTFLVYHCNGTRPNVPCDLRLDTEI